jgi:acetyltransferase-like isoleucine patch superfamily enzyme
MKSLCKALANAAAVLLVLPAFLLYQIARLFLGSRAFSGWSQAFSLFPGFLGAYLRRGFYRLTLQHCGRDACVSFGTIFADPSAELGDGVYVGAFCCLGDVTLQDDVLLGSHVSIPSGARQHGFEHLDVPIREQPGVPQRITIGHNTWVGDRAVILANVGQHCVIGAGAVVTQPIPDYSVAVGVPARVVRSRKPGTPETATDTMVTEVLDPPHSTPRK